MTLTITLTPEQEALLNNEAARRGLAVEEYARRALDAGMRVEAGSREARVKAARGKFAHLSLSVADFHREKQEEIEREERRFREHFGTARTPRFFRPLSNLNDV